jgi:hypothetical protein
MRRSAARSYAIIRRASPVSEMASEVRAGLDNLADAVRTLAGTMAAIAAQGHTKSLGDQRNMAAVMFADAEARFPDILRRLDKKGRDQLESYIDAICKGKR